MSSREDDDSVEDAIIVVDSSKPKPFDVEGASSSIMDMLESGMTIQAVAAVLNIDIETVSSVQTGLASAQRSQVPVTDKLRVWAEQTDDLIDLAHQAAVAEATPNNLYAYTAIVDCGISLTEAIEAKKDPKLIHEELVAYALEPMIENIMVTLTDKLSETKKSLDEITPEAKHEELSQQLKDVLRALGAVCKESLDQSIAKSLEVLTEKAKTKPVKKKKK